MELSFKAATFSDRGLVRKDNQDAILSLPADGFFAVADGMGGGQGGALAAQWTCDALEKAHGAPDAIMAALDTVHARIVRHADEQGYRSMGTTVALVKGVGNRMAQVLWVGDSRVYRLRQGAITQLTDDHTIGFELSRTVAGSATAHAVAVRQHPLAHVLTRAIGVGARLQPQVRDIELKDGDRYLICSDGVHDLLGTDDLQRVLSAPGVASAVAAVVAEVRARGAHDNFSMVCFDVQEA